MNTLHTYIEFIISTGLKLLQSAEGCANLNDEVSERGGGRACESGREGERQAARQIDRQKERETDKQTDTLRKLLEASTSLDALWHPEEV